LLEPRPVIHRSRRSERTTHQRYVRPIPATCISKTSTQALIQVIGSLNTNASACAISQPKLCSRRATASTPESAPREHPVRMLFAVPLARASDVDCHHGCGPHTLFPCANPKPLARYHGQGPTNPPSIVNPETLNLDVWQRRAPTRLASQLIGGPDGLGKHQPRMTRPWKHPKRRNRRSNTTSLCPEGRALTCKGTLITAYATFQNELEHDLGRPITAQETLSRLSLAEKLSTAAP
jgi:hypothetical protein